MHGCGGSYEGRPSGRAPHDGRSQNVLLVGMFMVHV